MVARAKRHSLYAVFHPALGPGGVRGRRGTQGRRRRYCTHKRRLIARGSAQGATLTQWLVLCAACAREVEVQIISPRPGTHVPSGAVPLRARLAMRAVATVPPTGWALSISLGEDGESTVVPGVEVNGELPALPPGAHSVTIALVDAEAGGAMLGPRAKVHFSVGVAQPLPEIIIEEPAARLLMVKAGETMTAVVRVARLATLDRYSAKVALNGIEMPAHARWLPTAVKGPGEGVEWRSVIGHLPDGLHVMDAELTDDTGSLISKDRRYFEIVTSNASHPRGGLDFAADSEDCCRALDGGRDFRAPPVPPSLLSHAFSPHASLVERDALELLDEWCALHQTIMAGEGGGGGHKRFLVLHAAAVPLGNRLQFLAGGFLVGILTRRAVLVDMGDLSGYFEAGASGSRGCLWNYGGLDSVQAAIQLAVGGKDAWHRDGWDSGWADGSDWGSEGGRHWALKTSAAVPVAWVELLSCVNLTSWLPDKGVLHLKSNQNLLPFVYSNPHHRQVLYGAFGQDAVGQVLRFMMAPVAGVARRLERMHEASNGTYLIGLQLRRRYGTAADRCPYKIPLPGPEGVQRRATYSHYSDAGEALLLECAASLARQVRRRVMFYVSSDTPEEVHDLVAQRLGWRNVIDKGDAFYTDENAKGVEDRKLVQEMLGGGVGDYSHKDAGLRAVLDMWMLASAHDLVITPSSTYGMMGAALNAATGCKDFKKGGPVFPTKWGKCARAVSRQPVCHSWLRIRRASCFVPEMLVPEFDMLCPECTLWGCPCDGANPCASHSDPDNRLDDPRFTKHLPL